MSLGHRIRQLRQARGLTQSQLGGPELTKSFISLLEKDRTQPSLDTLVLLARRLQTSVDSLLGQNGNIPEMVSEGLLALSREAIAKRQYDEAERHLAVVDSLASRYSLGEATCERVLLEGQIALERRAFGVALARFETALRIGEERHDAWRLGRALMMLGRVKLRQREFHPAIELFNSALAALRRARAGRDPARVETLIAMGTSLGFLGDYTGAIQKYREAARSYVSERDPKLRGQALWGIGLAERKLGNYEPAKEFLLKARDALEQAENLPDLMRVHQNIGQLMHEQGKSREALRHLHHALRVAERITTAVDRASTLTEIARVNISLTNVEDAEHFAQQALAEAGNVGDPVEVAEAKTVLADIRVRRNDVSGAIELMKEALAIFRERKMRGKIAVVARELGLLLRSKGAHAHAAEYLALSLEHTQGGLEAAAEVSE